MINRLLVLAVALLISACGFQLRGSVNLPAGVEPIFIGGEHANSQLGIEVRNLLNGNDIELADTQDSANYRLIITERNSQIRTLSLGGGTTAAEYQLTETATFELLNKQAELVLGPRTITQRSILRNDPNQVLSSGQEEQLLRREMLANLASQIARQLGSFSYQQSAASPAGDINPPPTATLTERP